MSTVTALSKTEARLAVEELLRRHGLSNTARMVRHDMVHKGANLKEGELIMTVNALSGLDAKRYADPFKVDFDRGPVGHNSFGNGPHKCVGQHLARPVIDDDQRGGEPAAERRRVLILGHAAWKKV